MIRNPHILNGLILKKEKAFFVLLGLFIVLLLMILPQIISIQYPNATITSKFIVFIFACLIITGIFIISVFGSKTKTLYVSKLDIILITFLAYISLNRYIIQPHVGFSIRYLEVLGLGVIYLVLRNVLSKSYTWLLLAIVISGIAQAVYGNLQLLDYYPSNHSGFKLTGSFFNQGPYAGFLTAVWPLSLGLYLFKENSIKQVQSQIHGTSGLINKIIIYALNYIPLLGCISIILILPATHSRASWLAVLLSSIVLIEMRYHVLKGVLKHISRIKKAVLIIVSIGIIGSGLLGMYHFKKGSSDGRLFIWKVTTEIIIDHPVFGVGFDWFKTHYMNYQADYFARNGKNKEALVADNTYYAFNEWLQFIAENGLMGLAVLILLLYYIFKIQVNKQCKYMYLCLISSLLSIGIFALFSYSMQILPIKLILVVLLAQLGNLDNNKQFLFKKPKQYALVGFKTVMLILSIIGITKSIQYTTALEQNLRTWKNALDDHQYGDYQGASNLYSKAYPILKGNGNFLMNYGKSLSLAQQDRKALQILLESQHYLNTTIIETSLGDSYKNLKKYKKAETAYQHAANMIPSRFYPLYLQAKLYDENGDKTKAIAMAKEILKKNIKIPSTAIKEMQAEIKKIVDTEK